ncbi:MAG TPA: carboxypeptidase-like regulatory domain-containing protein, partial [Bryobacteraceae bacterium]|nr:carboxypeptidase-like regulatory domain-containing protein [Bryobacteraceae bacterium]
MNRASLVALLTIFMLAVAMADIASAQVLYGSAVGTVEDQTGALVSGASVTMTNTSTGLVREDKTGANGRYSFTNLLPGRYDVKVVAAGFRTYTQTNVEITINTVTRVDVKLELGQVTEQITVEASAAALQTDKSDVRSEITS